MINLERKKNWTKTRAQKLNQLKIIRHAIINKVLKREAIKVISLGFQNKRKILLTATSNVKNRKKLDVVLGTLCLQILSEI